MASAAGSASQRARAAKQARLPVKHGGMGLTSMESIRDAAWVGTWALVWKPLRELHEPFRAVDITRESDGEFQQLSIFTELQAAHASLMTRYETVAATYAQYDRQLYDYCKEGLAHYRFHPDGLPGRETRCCRLRHSILAESTYKTLSVASPRSCIMQRGSASGTSWWARACRSARPCASSRRASLTRATCSTPSPCGPSSGFRVPSWAMRVIVQRRLGLPLDECLARGAPTCTARGGKVQDPMGDAASNIGRAGHNQRHAAVLRRLVQCMQSVWGKLVEMEPQDHLGYSNDYRPDLTARGLGAGGKRLVGDVKFKDPLSSNPEDIKRRGCFVGFGCTEPGTRAAMYGLEQRGEKGDGDFRPGDGGGYVAPKKADYSHLLSRGDSDLQMLLFETFGGWSVPVVRLFNKMRDKVRDKLSKKQYDDEVSWTTRTWSSLMAQRMSVALHMAAAWEIARELSLAGAEDEAALFGGGVADSVA